MPGGGEVGAEGLLDNHAGPAAGFRLVESRIFEVNQDFIKELRSRCDIEESVPLSTVPGIDGIEFFRKAAVAFGVGEFRGVIGNGLNEALPDFAIACASVVPILPLRPRNNILSNPSTPFPAEMFVCALKT